MQFSAEFACAARLARFKLFRTCKLRQVPRFLKASWDEWI